VEEALDVEWAHAIAPNANILLVEANSANSSDLLSAVDTARNAPGVVAVSMSWGGPEDPTETGFESHFTTPAGHAGITFIAASGDYGAPAIAPTRERHRGAPFGARGHRFFQVRVCSRRGRQECLPHEQAANRGADIPVCQFSEQTLNGLA
jgi:hypothetical protein